MKAYSDALMRIVECASILERRPFGERFSWTNIRMSPRSSFREIRVAETGCESVIQLESRVFFWTRV